jgi:hypothetical protein
MSIAAATAEGQTLSPILIAACLDDLARVLSDRPDVPEDQRPAHAGATKRLILSFRPQDAMQLMLAGHAVLFSTLAADGARDIMRGLAEPMKSRARSNVTAMGRLVSKHVDTLIRLQRRLDRTEARADTPGQIPTSPVRPPPRHAAPEHEPTDAEERGDTPAIEPPAEQAPTPTPLAQPAPSIGPYPGREAMLAARPSRVSRRKKAQLANKLMNVLRTAQTA